MRKIIVMAGLLAAASAFPALAQERQWRDRGEGGPAAEVVREPRADGGGQSQRAERPQRDWSQRGEARAQGQAPQAQAQAPVQVQQAQQIQQAQGRRNWQGNATQGGGYQGARADAQARYRDRDRDNDGVRNRRDADANGNGRVDRRYDQNRDGQVDRRFDRNQNGRIDPRYGNTYGRNGYGYGNNNNNRWSRDWRNDRRYDWNSYRNSNRYLFRQPRYNAPYGWNYGYRRFSVGIYLNSLLYSRSYWIDDPYQYRLPPAYPPYHWVRYYDDALLIDERSGYVVDAIYDFFY